MVVKRILSKKITFGQKFWLKNNFWSKNFGPKKSYVQKVLGSKDSGSKKKWLNKCGQKHWFKETLGPRKFWVRNNVRSKIIIGLKKNLSQIFWGKKIFGPKKFSIQINVGSKKTLDPQKVLGPKKFWIRKNVVS